MASLLSRVATLIGVWLGLTRPSDGSMTPAHGWLLPRPGDMGSLKLARVVVPVTKGSSR
jgi:hypothetical protein